MDWLEVAKRFVKQVEGRVLLASHPCSSFEVEIASESVMVVTCGCGAQWTHLTPFKSGDLFAWMNHHQSEAGA